MLRISSGLGVYLIVVTQVMSALFGWFKLRKMDFNLFFFLDAELKKGENIVKELWEEAWILTAVCLLLLPGFVSDIIGCMFLIPPLRTFFLTLFEDLK
ncbi:MAG: FxsA family protein [Proteobacteria bacterium]|nr:FxsA family protein [Pseudomonadota bacterium]